MTSDHAKAVRDLLTFYTEAGVDAVLGETANDFLTAPAQGAAAPQVEVANRAPTEPPRRVTGSPPIQPAGPAAVLPAAEAAATSAREAARRAASLEELRAILEGFDGCALKLSATQLVFADGNPQARVMFVGEAPGAEEDRQGKPFVGKSGKLLDRMMAAVGLDRTQVYIANIVPWRPPGNRTPTPVETQTCLPFLLRQIELVGPDVLVTMGNPSTQTLLQTSDGITRTRGRWFPFKAGEREIRVMPTFHPAFLLRSPLQKRLAWRDFLAVKKALAG
jgi:uracil-DNA glycosylase family 4